MARHRAISPPHPVVAAVQVHLHTIESRRCDLQRLGCMQPGHGPSCLSSLPRSIPWRPGRTSWWRQPSLSRSCNLQGLVPSVPRQIEGTLCFSQWEDRLSPDKSWVDSLIKPSGCASLAWLGQASTPEGPAELARKHIDLGPYSAYRRASSLSDSPGQVICRR